MVIIGGFSAHQERLIASALRNYANHLEQMVKSNPELATCFDWQNDIVEAREMASELDSRLAWTEKTPA